MPKKITITEIKNKLFEAHGNTITIVENTYKAQYKKASFIHKKYGLWDAVVVSILNGSSHKKAGFDILRIKADNKIKPLSEIKEKLFKVHNGSITIVDSTYVGSKKKATFVSEDGSKWDAIVYNVLNGTRHTKYHKKLYTRKEVEEKIFLAHGNTIKIVWDTFTKVKSKAKFVHEKYGEFWTCPSSIFIGRGPKDSWIDKRKATNLKRYGVEYCSQNREIALRIAKNSNKPSILSHWKTNEELVCQGGYEPKVVNYLNSNKINYLWQPKVFNIPNGRTYRPDLFLQDEDKWIEIKGFFRKDALEKWNWFQSEYPNSELWDEKKLKSLGIL
jgi:hypothetical protein